MKKNKETTETFKLRMNGDFYIRCTAVCDYETTDNIQMLEN